MSDLEIINGRQQLAPKIDSSVKDIERLLVAVINIKEVIIYTGIVENVKSSENVEILTDNDRDSNVNINYNNDNNNVISDISKIEMIQEIWSKYKSKGAPPPTIEKDNEDSEIEESKYSKKKDKLKRVNTQIEW